MRNTIGIILLISFLASWAHVQEKSQLNVATFNLRMNTKNDEENAWPNRKEMVKGLVQFHDFDIFGTQEGYIHQLKDILELEAYSYVGVGRNDGKEAGEHSAIFYKKDRFALLENGDFWLSETPEKPSFGWDAQSHKRICSWAKFKEKASGKEFYFFSVHYDHKGVVARKESSLLMIERVKSITKGKPFFCVGDFNAKEDDEPIQIILDEGTLIDSKSLSKQPPYGTSGTFQSFKLDAPMKDRIDYIFVAKGMVVNKYGVLNDMQYGRFPSDHFPVMIQAEF